MKKYEIPCTEILTFNCADVITLSAFTSKQTGEGVDWDWSVPSAADEI